MLMSLNWLHPRPLPRQLPLYHSDDDYDTSLASLLVILLSVCGRQRALPISAICKSKSSEAHANTGKNGCFCSKGRNRMLYLAASLAAQPVNPTPGKPDDSVYFSLDMYCTSTYCTAGTGQKVVSRRIHPAGLLCKFGMNACKKS